MLHFKTVSPGTLDLLINLCAHMDCGPFALCGGTALALRFGHRRSIDLDFFSPAKFDTQAMAQSLHGAFGFEAQNVNDIGLSGIIDGVKVDFVAYRYPLLQPFETIGRIRFFSLSDNVSMKLAAIVNRGAKKDFYDLNELIKVLGMSEMMRIYHTKFPEQDLSILLRSSVYFEDAEEDMDPESLDGTTWDAVKTTISLAVRACL